jgi:hypothetical protein
MPDPDATVDPITNDDLADVGDLITQDPDMAAAAEVIGDPATLLGEGRRQAEKARADVAAAISFFRDVSSGEAVKRGATPDGRGAFARWEKDVAGKRVGVSVIRADVGRFHYVVNAIGADGTRLPLLRGVFVKKGPRTGGGRLHVNLTNLSDTFNAPGVDGSIHFWFANHRGDKRARRIIYADAVRRDDPDMRKINFGADLVRIVGTGGRFRSVGITDMIPALPGPEAVGLRILWKAGEGGRAASAIASVGATPMLLGTAHECWGSGGLRTAYEDDNPNNDAMNPNEGDVTMCAGFAKEPPPDQGDVNENGLDTDPEADALLEESGAAGIAEADVEAVDDAGL